MTMNTDTPETDAELNYRSYGFFCTMGGLPAEAVGADFARELERERDEAQERADTMFAKHAEILDQARNERDELIRAGRALKTAKGRFHTEQAAIKLFNLLP